MKYTTQQVGEMLKNAPLFLEQLRDAAKERGWTEPSVAPIVDVIAFLRIRIATKGDRFDSFGEIWEVIKVQRDGSVDMARRVTDPFGKESMIDHRSFKPHAMAHMRLVSAS
jgi:hypothetical protein